MPARFAPDLLLAVLLPLAAPALAQVSVQEYAIPRGHYAHDVWADAAPGGPVWFSAQRGGELGILDPASGKVEFVPLGPGSAPHGVIAGADGAPWLTDGGQNAIVRVDPKTRQVKAWPLPEGSGYTNLNTATFDRNGVHWFTGQSGIYRRLAARLRGVRRRDRQGVGLGVERAGDAALRSGEREVRHLQVIEPERQRAPDPRPQGRGLDARVRGRQDRRVPLPIAAGKKKRARRSAPFPP